MQAPDFDAMTKAAIAKWAADEIGMEVNNRLSKAAMIAEVVAALPPEGNDGVPEVAATISPAVEQEPPADNISIIITDMRQQPLRLGINGRWREIPVRTPIPHSPQLMAALEAASISYEWV